MTNNELKQIITTEQFKKLYTDDDLSYTEMADKINIPGVTKTALRRLNSEEYHIKKDKEKSRLKYEQTCLEKYGVSHVFQNSAVKEKIKNTNILKYGSENPFASDIIKEKIRQSNISKYGVDNPQKNSDIRKKTRQTNLKKYNAPAPMMAESVLEKAKETTLRNYGVARPSQNKNIMNKIKDTNMKKYGVTCTLHNIEINDKTLKTNIERYGVEHPLQNQNILNKTQETIKKKYNVDWYCLSDNCKNKSNASLSKPNNMFAEKLSANNIEFTKEFVLENRAFDFKIGNVLYEVDPSYTHNSTYGYKNDKPKDKMYHYNKSKLAERYNYRCVHIFDWDNVDIILGNINKTQIIYARKCDIRNVDKNEANLFLDKNHLQGKCNGNVISYGLSYKNELVEIMTFGKPRYNKKYEYELLRLCTAIGAQVIGGAEKLFAYFIKNIDVQSVISYCDLSKFNGDVYEKLGFTLKRVNQPSKHYVNKHTLHITDSLLRQKGFDKLFNTNYGKGTDNNELMIQHGFVEVYDCGQAVYIYLKNREN